jgi:polynucleotide kinase-phosphatase
MKISVPDLSVVLMVGASGCGKSTFAGRHFKPTEVLSSDFCRGLVADNENDQSATSDAFDILYFIARKRLAAGRLTVVDATNVKSEDRKSLIELAREHHVLAVAIVFDIPASVCQERNRSRPDRSFGPHVIRQQTDNLRRSLRTLKREGFHHVFVLSSTDEVDQAEIERVPLWTDRRSDQGPFDIIGDVHGCFDELVDLLRRTGYEVTDSTDAPTAKHPEGRKAIFLGDLVDRGPNSPAVLRLVMSMVEHGTALCLPGNHDVKLLRKLRGRDVRITHGLAETLEQLEPESDEFKQKVAGFIDDLVSHYVLDGGRLVVAHAGLKADLQGRASARVREFAMYGETTGETDDYGLPVRYNWAADYRGKAMVVYGHTPVVESQWLNRTICIDSGCVFGGSLTALRYPEKELVQIPARKMYYAPARPLNPEDTSPPVVTDRPYNDVLDIEDVLGKRIITTRLSHSITIREENAIAAIEVMSRFAVDPHWLIYLPPTMAPPETSKRPDYLEYPEEVFRYFRNEGVPAVVCEEKHMGSRAVIVLCRDEEAAKKHFGIRGEGIGVIYTRTGRRFFNDRAHETEILSRLRLAMDHAGWWDEFATSWICLDAEIMPWSSKAQDLLKHQYAPTGTSAKESLAVAVRVLAEAAARNGGGDHLRKKFEERFGCIDQYIQAYGRYCWTVRDVNDLKVAPFHILATQGKVHTNQNHVWHMEKLSQLCSADEALLHSTAFKTVNVTDPESEQSGIEWWLERTGKGSEGMVVKPLDWMTRGRKGLVQPALKCRGREYLRIIYGPEYTLPEHMDRLRERGVGLKRSLASREFALGVEALHRFTEGEPLYRVHECIFGVLAMESEPVDPRL